MGTFIYIDACFYLRFCENASEKKIVNNDNVNKLYCFSISMILLINQIKLALFLTLIILISNI